MAYFIAIREEDLRIIPSDYSRNLRMCAAALLNFFRNCQHFQGWWAISISELHERLLGQFGKDAIASAGELLNNLGLVLRKNNRLNHRAWEYKYTGEVFRAQKSLTTEVRATVAEVTVTAAETTITAADCTAYIDNSLDNSENCSEKENNVSAASNFFEEEIDQDELRAMEIDPEEVKQCINRNCFNYKWALFQLKKFYVTGNCQNPTGFLMSRLSCRQDKSSALPDFSRECPQPSDRQLQELCQKYGDDNVGRMILDIPEMGYPLTWVALIDDQYCPWWEALS